MFVKGLGSETVVVCAHTIFAENTESRLSTISGVVSYNAYKSIKKWECLFINQDASNVESTDTKIDACY